MGESGESGILTERGALQNPIKIPTRARLDPNSAEKPPTSCAPYDHPSVFRCSQKLIILKPLSNSDVPISPSFLPSIRSRSVGRLSARRGAAALRAELLVARHGAHLDEAAVQALHLFALVLKSQLVRFNEMIEGILQVVNTSQLK